MSGPGLVVLLVALAVVSFTAGWVFRDARARGLSLQGVDLGRADHPGMAPAATALPANTAPEGPGRPAGAGGRNRGPVGGRVGGKGL